MIDKEGFADWMKRTGRKKELTDRQTEMRDIEKIDHVYKLDESYDKDRLQSVIADLSYSDEDAARKLEKDSKLKFQPRLPKTDPRYFQLLKKQYYSHRRLVERYRDFRNQRHDIVGDILEIGPLHPRKTPVASDCEKPGRVETTIYRILRDTLLARQVKELHNYECQMCGDTIQLADGTRYAEAHHIQPLGAPHDGPDKLGNIICVCPKHHVFLDYFSIPLNVDQIRTQNEHQLDEAYIYYHNKRHQNRKGLLQMTFPKAATYSSDFQADRTLTPKADPVETFDSRIIRGDRRSAARRGFGKPPR